MSKTLKELSDVTSVVKNKGRRTLRPLQDTINNLLEKKMGNGCKTNSPKKGKQKASEKTMVSGKENGPVIRRSKRTAAIPAVTYAETPVPEAVKIETKNAKEKTKTVTKIKKSRTNAKRNVGKNQTKLNFKPNPEEPIVATKAVPKSEPENKPEFKGDESEKETKAINSSTSVVTDDSGFCPCPGTSASEVTSTPLSYFNDVRENSVSPYSCENSILTVDNPSVLYWKDLAEQRRIVLEKVLHENELLHDQLEVLEVENSQLKQLVKEAEELAKVVKGIIE